MEDESTRRLPNEVHPPCWQRLLSHLRWHSYPVKLSYSIAVRSLNHICYAFLSRERTEELAASITLEQGKTLAGEEEMQGMQVDWFARLMDP